MKLKCSSITTNSNIEYWPIIRSIESGKQKAREWYIRQGRPKHFIIKIYDDENIYWGKKTI